MAKGKRKKKFSQRLYEWFNVEFSLIKKSVVEVLQKRGYVLALLIVMPLLMMLFLSMPVITSPHITLINQLNAYSFLDYAFILSLAVIVSLNGVMQFYNIRASSATVGKAASTGSFGSIVALVGTATCPSCLMALFGFLGVGTLFFLVEYRLVISGLAMVFMFLSLNSVSKKISGNCESCNVDVAEDE